MITLPDIEINISETETRNITKDLFIDPANLSECLITHSALYAYYAAHYAKMKALVDKAKLRVETQKDYIEKTLKSKLDYQAREYLINNNERVTDSRINAYIGTSQEFLTEQEKLNEYRRDLVDAQSKLALLEVAKDSMYQRKDMLINVGAQIRAESGNMELYLKENAYKNYV